jgi:FAD/FMN-containing dehydrogenase
MESYKLTSELLSPAVIADICEQVSGTVITPEDKTYDDVRKVWNGMIDRRPALIIQCQSVNDVIVGVKTAKQYQLPLAVRGGGHNVTGNAVCDDGVMIDFSQMRKVLVEPELMTAKAQPGATWGDFDKATGVYGLATTGGLISTTGIAGLTLGGGVGWLVRHYGMSCDNLLSAEVVTANGELVVASTTENADLFWGLRGGGGNFGVVTSFTYRLHPVSTVYGGMILFPRSEAKRLLQFFGRFMETAPDELTLYAALLHAPDGTPVVGLMGCYSGDPKLGEDVLKPVREFGTPIVDLFTEQPYTQLQTMLDAPFPHGLRYYWKSGFLESLSDEAVDTIIDYAATVPSLITPIILELYGGKAAQEPEGGTAFPHRINQYDLVIISAWANLEEDDANISWTRSLWNAVQSFTSNRAYVNTLGIEGEQRVREAYGKNYERLQELKKKYDPDNLFHLNQNIDPTN